ncbi:hypothetical protein [Cupriavidus sp. D384]|uniref:hypothetical protein n=1 Tax=Cupriavidus sp. D384 TaxID=1538095 RepID=UPI000AB08C7D|nr:hypothetical protein [Cupriavidus sp. D384]
MSLIEIRKRHLIVETTYHEGGPPVAQQAGRLSGCGPRLSFPVAGDRSRYNSGRIYYPNSCCLK